MSADDGHHDFQTPEHEMTWLDRPGNKRLIVTALYVICALLILIDPLIHKHGPFAIEHWVGFYAVYGFISCVGLVLVSKLLRQIVKRPEDYYDE